MSCFNSRPRAAGDIHNWGRGGQRIVSTHARARRATNDAICGQLGISVSTHARARRATSSVARVLGASHDAQDVGFNSRPRAAGDPQWQRAQSTRRRERSVSTHARARRATAPSTSDCTHARLTWTMTTFQLTPARGGRPRISRVRVVPTVSTHARARRATAPLRHSHRGDSFQLTPARGGRQACERRADASGVSTHARARRATHSLANLIAASRFNSRPRAAGDNTLSRYSAVGWFQLTPARGGRPQRVGDQRNGVQFQLTPARGGRPGG